METAKIPYEVELMLRLADNLERWANQEKPSDSLPAGLRYQCSFGDPIYIQYHQVLKWLRRHQRPLGVALRISFICIERWLKAADKRDIQGETSSFEYHFAKDEAIKLADNLRRLEWRLRNTQDQSQKLPTYAEINVRARLIVIDDEDPVPMSPMVLDFFVELKHQNDIGGFASKKDWKNQYDMLTRKIGKENRSLFVLSAKYGYLLSNAKVRQ